ncbi:hypothetical protein ACFOYU_18920 [Microvirga sp. GCM10011540]|uniref:hypothetical protein n=1 Tax=Microvirga sp. GCM10011540 TaxID=3317338 RepID=UPI003605EED4
MSDPKTDDFRLEQKDGQIVVTFTPTGAQYVFAPKGSDPKGSGGVEPRQEEPAQGASSDYDEDAVRQMAKKLAEKAAGPAPDLG